MTPARLSFAAIVLLASNGARAQTTANLGIAGTVLPGDPSGEFLAFAASEPSQNVDLNGDGATNDFVLHLHRLSTGVTTNTGLTLPPLTPWTVSLGERLCATPVRESSLGPGGTDLNGDGDAIDDVYAVYDLRTNVTTNLSLAAFSGGLGLAATNKAHLVLGVSEAAQGADLNGDGDLLDVVLHSWAPGGAPARNHALALQAFATWGPIAMGPQHALFLVDEGAQGTDLNGDGVLSTDVVHVLALASGLVTNLGFAAYDMRNDGELFAFSVPEGPQGQTDLNGDGDASDTVLFAYLAPSATVRNLGRAVAFTSTGPQYDVKGHVLAWASDEAESGPTGTDWNVDGDIADSVLFTHHARSGATRNSGLAVEFPGGAGFHFAISGELLGTSVSEQLQGGIDLNGDGDATDLVAMLFNAGTGAVTNLGLAALASPSGLRASRELFAFSVWEPSQGQQDLNGDGVLGFVVAAHRFATGATSILPAPCATVLDVRVVGPNIVYMADENPNGQPSGVDLNGDGDAIDDVLASWSAATGVATNHVLAVQGGVSVFRIATSRSGAVFSVGEALQGAGDLNGDGDTIDAVVHALRF